MPSDATHSVATIASLLMLSERRVQQLTREGVIPRAERGRYELVPAVQGYVRYLQERGGSSSDSPIDYHEQKARLTKAQADMAEIELARARGDVVGVAQLEKNLGSLFAEVQTNIRNIPGRIASSLAGAKDESAIKRMMLAEIDQVLQSLADARSLIEPSDDIEGDDGEL